MAVSDLGLSRVEGDESTYDSIVIRPDDEPEELFVKLRTLWQDSHRYLDLAIAWRGVRRGDVQGGMGYGDYEASDVGPRGEFGDVAWYFRHFPVSELTKSEQDEFGPGTWWAAPLDFVSQDESTVDYVSLVQRIFGGDYSYNAREWDAILLHVKAKFWYAVKDTDGEFAKDEDNEEILTTAPLEERELYIGYIPTYHAQAARMTRAGLEVDYTSPGWDRASDRWALDHGLSAGGQEVVRGKIYGTLAEHGTILIPADQLSSDPAGKALSGTVRFNACWRPIDMPFAEMSLDGIVVQDTRTANTPTISAAPSPSGTGVVVTVGDSGDRGVPLEEVDVRLVGAEFGFDRATLLPGESHEFRLCPIGVPTTWEAIGWAAGDARSDAARATCGAVDGPDGSFVLESVGEGVASVELIYDREESWDAAPSMATAKLSGRQRESAFWGEGGSVTGSLSCDIVTLPVAGMVAQREGDFRELAFAGPCVLRRPDGTRTQLAVESVGVRTLSQPWQRQVTLSVREVA